MKILWWSEFSAGASGYSSISIPVCDLLGKRGHDVKAIGLGYDGREHNFEFSLFRGQELRECHAIMHNLNTVWKPDILVVAMDIPIQEGIIKRIQEKGFKYVGIMPIEADPLCISHAMVLMQMDKAFIISQFGTNEAEKVGIDAEHLQIGIDTNSWRFATSDERKKLREAMGFRHNTFVVLTVAANQERKNLSAGLEIFKTWLDKYHHNNDIDAKYVIVTGEHGLAGWNLKDLAQEYGIADKLIVMEKGMPFGQLWGLYSMADAFLLPSKAEGLGLPILESMATGLPVIGTDCTAIGELLADDRGFPVKWAYK